MLFHLLISLWHEYTITPDIVIICTCIIVTRKLQYTGYSISCRFLLHWTLLFHVLVSPLHGCYITPDTVISYTCIIVTWILLFYGHISRFHKFTCIHSLIVPVFMLLESLFILHDLLLHEFSCILVTWVFNMIHDCLLYLWYWYDISVS